MQLILVDRSEAYFSAYEPSDLEYYDGHPFNYGTTEEVDIRPGSSGERTNRGATADSTRRLVLEILTKTSQADKSNTLTLFLSNARRDPYMFDLTVKSVSEFNILKELRSRFKDKVKVSVSINCSNNVEEWDAYGVVPGGRILGSTTGIREDNTCKLGPLYLRNFVALKWLAVNLKVTANISDDAFTPKVRTVSVLGKIRKVFDEGLFSDVVITAENGVQLKAHRSFLVASSSVFEKMFGIDLKESKTGKVDMTDLSEEGVRAFLRYIYFNETVQPDGDISLAVELLYAAHKYDVQALEASMIQHLLLERKEEDLGTEEAFTIYMFVRTIESAIALKKKVIEILHKNADELEALPEYIELCETNPRDAQELAELIAKVNLKK